MVTEQLSGPALEVVDGGQCQEPHQIPIELSEPGFVEAEVGHLVVGQEGCKGGFLSTS